jgi:membrane protein
MDVNAWYNKLKTLADDPGRRSIGLYASSGVYYLFLSLAPLAALLLALVPYTSVTEQQLLEALLAYTPDSFQALMNVLIAQVYDRAWSVLSVSFLLELWSAAKFLSSVVQGVEQLYGLGREQRGFLRRRLMGAVYTLALVMLVVGGLALGLVSRRALGLEERFSGLLRWRWVIGLLGLTGMLTLLFSAVCRGQGRGFLSHVPGSAAAAAGSLVFSRGYSWAVGRFGLFGLYGSLAILSVSLFWMYGTVYILFFGAWLNAVLAKGGMLKCK